MIPLFPYRHSRLFLFGFIPCIWALFIFIISPCPASAEEYCIAMIMWRGETIAEKGFIDELDKSTYDIALNQSWVLNNSGFLLLSRSLLF